MTDRIAGVPDRMHRRANVRVDSLTLSRRHAGADFERLRARREYTHAANAVLTLLALAAALASSFMWKGG